MDKYTLKETEWIAQLKSENPADMLTAIREIRHHGNIKMLPYLFSLMLPSTHEIIRKSIVLLISEIKVQEAVPVIVGELEKGGLGNEIIALVAACWQSGLDFSQHLPAFIKIFARGDYQTAIEAFSVIEESIINASPDIQKECLKMLDSVAGEVSEEKYPLFRELVKVVSAA
jgi:hypothetical protein